MFKETYDKIVEVYEGLRPKDWLPEHFASERCSGYVVERSFVWVSCSEFQAEHKCSPSDIGIPIETLQLDHNKTEKGILVVDSAQPLRVKKFHTVYGKLSEVFHDGTTQLRSNQGSEIADWYYEDQNKHLPRAFAKASGGSVANTKEHLKELVAVYVKRREEQAREAQTRAEAVAEVAMDEKDDEKPDGEPELEEEEVETAEAKPLIMSMATRAAAKKGALRQGKGKQKGKPQQAKERKTRQAAKAMASRTSVAQSLPESCRADPVLGSNAGKSVAVKAPSGASARVSFGARSSAERSRAGGKKGSSSSYIEKAETARKALSVEKLLTGEQNGRDTWQSQMSLDALEANRPGCAEGVLLTAHLSLARMAEEPEWELGNKEQEKHSTTRHAKICQSVFGNCLSSTYKRLSLSLILLLCKKWWQSVPQRFSLQARLRSVLFFSVQRACSRKVRCKWFRLGGLDSIALQECCKAQVLKVAPDRLRHCINEFAENRVALQIPSWQSLVLTSLAKQTPDVDEWLKLLSPHVLPGRPWPETWEKWPCLSLSCLCPADVSKVYQRLVVHERIIPCMAKGEHGVTELLKISHGVIEIQRHKPDTLDVMVAVAIETVAEIGMFIIALASKETNGRVCVCIWLCLSLSLSLSVCLSLSLSSLSLSFPLSLRHSISLSLSFFLSLPLSLLIRLALKNQRQFASEVSLSNVLSPKFYITSQR